MSLGCGCVYHDGINSAGIACLAVTTLAESLLAYLVGDFDLSVTEALLHVFREKKLRKMNKNHVRKDQKLMRYHREENEL